MKASLAALATGMASLAAGASVPRDSSPPLFALQMYTQEPVIIALTGWYVVSVERDGEPMVLLLNPDDDAPNGGATPFTFGGTSANATVNFQPATNPLSGTFVPGGLTVPGRRKQLGVNANAAGSSGFLLSTDGPGGAEVLGYHGNYTGGFYGCLGEVDNELFGKVYWGPDASNLPSSCGSVELVVSEFSNIVA